MKKTVATLLVCAMMLGTQGVVSAQETPKGDANGKVSDDVLGKMLTDMGYEVKTERSDGYVWHDITVKGGGLTFHVTVNLSANKEFVWFKTTCAEAPRDKEVAGKMALRLLEENVKIGPAHFVYDSKNHYIKLWRPLFNRSITPAVLKKSIDNLVERAVETRNLWDEKQFKATVAPGGK